MVAPPPSVGWLFAFEKERKVGGGGGDGGGGGGGGRGRGRGKGMENLADGFGWWIGWTKFMEWKYPVEIVVTSRRSFRAAGIIEAASPL